MWGDGGEGRGAERVFYTAVSLYLGGDPVQPAKGVELRNVAPVWGPALDWTELDQAGTGLSFFISFFLLFLHVFVYIYIYIDSVYTICIFLVESQLQEHKAGPFIYLSRQRRGLVLAPTLW